MVKIQSPIRKYAIAKGEEGPEQAAFTPSYTDDDHRRLRLVAVPEPVMASLRWEKRPRLSGGNPSWTYIIESPTARFGMVVGHVQNGHAYPFEVATVYDPPRGLNAIARSLSMDMRSRDRGWLQRKLESLIGTEGEPFDLEMPNGQLVRASGEVSAFARILRHRCEELGAFDDLGSTPVLDALMARREPKTTGDGGLSWYVDVDNPATGDNFTVFVKEVILPNGQKRPLSIWFAGKYPRALDGLCKLLSLDLQVIDPEWALRKLQQLTKVSEDNGGFFAPVPGSEKSSWYTSSIAYVASALQHRFHVLGLCDRDGHQSVHTGAMESREAISTTTNEPGASAAARLCSECQSYAVTRVSGCDTCGACGASKCQ